MPPEATKHVAVCSTATESQCSATAGIAAGILEEF